MIMSLVYRIGFASLFVALISFTGCCTRPMICPNGVGGPLAFTSTCAGCDQCDGCGELYVDPWINHPAERCDPCDGAGNYNGQSCGECRSVFVGFPSLWGYRATPMGCDGCGDPGCAGGYHDGNSGCDSCDGGCSGSKGKVLNVQPMEVPQVDSQVMRIVEPTPAGKVIVAQPSDSRYRPYRSREIFHDRQNVASGDEDSIEY